MPDTTETVIERDLAQATKVREDLLSRRAKLDQEIREAEQRYARLRHVQAVLQGRVSIEPAAERKPRAPSGPRAPRGKRGEMREKIIELLQQGPLAAEAIYAEMEATEKKDKSAISNLLTRMKAEGAITQTAVKQPYSLAPAGREPQPEAP